MGRLLRRLFRRGTSDAGRMSLGAGTALCFTGIFALVTGVQVVSTADVGTAGGGFRSGDIPYHAADIPPGSLVDCGTAGRVTELTCNAYRTILANYPEFDRPGWRGCLRTGDSGDHGAGKACDFMTNVEGSQGTAEQNALGFDLARWLMANHEQMGIKYLIWHQRIWNPGPGFRDPPCVDETRPETFAQSCWRLMEDRGSNTQNHYDHVHVSFLH